MFPHWFHNLAVAALWLGGACSIVVLVDVIRHPQKMVVMNVVWPVTALFGTMLTVWGYFAWGRASAADAATGRRGGGAEAASAQPYPVVVGKGTLHCGAGCMLGDLLAEWLAFFFPVVAVWFGWHSLFDDRTFAVWVLDFVFAFVIGIAFQYFAIVPMRDLSPGAGIVAALKADTLSLAAWQVGMYGLMAMAQFVLYRHAFGAMAEVDSAEFWFTMQVAMIAGFATAYPVNAWLIKVGIKEKM